MYIYVCVISMKMNKKGHKLLAELTGRLRSFIRGQALANENLPSVREEVCIASHQGGRQFGVSIPHFSASLAELLSLFKMDILYNYVTVFSPPYPGTWATSAVLVRSLPSLVR